MNENTPTASQTPSEPIVPQQPIDPVVATDPVLVPQPKIAPTQKTTVATETAPQTPIGTVHTMQEDIADMQESPVQGERPAGVMPNIEEDIAFHKKHSSHGHAGLWWAIGIVTILLIAGFVVAFLVLEGIISF